ncbi:hypothetical protein HCN44_001850 [Aphidius gifuensis]|uniref:Metaxin-1 n=1 Tax=Aphidius gifuensis TaxID=684658 RepID=A0A834Y1Y5_APHGI|nr:hypothetical protein HCN44_001850 [Aphidius gifuensis]
MDDSNNYQIDVWKGDWGLPSIDIQCLQVLAYAKFSDVPLTIREINNPFRTPRGLLPVLRYDNKSLDSPDDIIQFFRKMNYTCDDSLTPKQCADIVSYDHMLKESLYPAMQYIWWIDQKNFTELMRPWYAKAIPFPLNFYYPSQYEKQAQAMMESLYPNEESMTQKCITLLSNRLGDDSDYFFGTKPTYLDAIVYSYLAPLLKLPLPNSSLQNHLKACTNLVKFISKISQRYFEQDYQNYEKIKAKEQPKNNCDDVDIEFPHKRRNQFIAGFIATLAMISYALFTGIVEVTPIRDDDDTLDDHEDYMDDIDD